MGVAVAAFLVVVLLILPALAADVRATVLDLGDSLPWLTRWAITPAFPRLLGLGAALPLLLAFFPRWPPARRRRALLISLIVASLAVAVCLLGLVWPRSVMTV